MRDKGTEVVVGEESDKTETFFPTTSFVPILFGTRFAHSSEPHISVIALGGTARIILAWAERNARRSATKTSRG